MAIDKSRNFITLVRLGFAARGLTYILLGYLALGTTGKAMEGQNGVFDYLQEVPLGTTLLWVVAVGLLAYALFKLISAIANIQNHSDDAKGAAHRVGDLASGIAHIGLAYAAWRFATGGKPQSGGSEAMAEPVMDITLGPVLIGLGGLGAMIAAAMQARRAITASFMKDIAGNAPSFVKPVGQAGHAARAVVFAIIGWSLVRGAWLVQETAIKGLGEALVSLRGMGVVYTLVAIGLLMFGAFSLVTARYRIIPDFDSSQLKPDLPG